MFNPTSLISVEEKVCNEHILLGALLRKGLGDRSLPRARWACEPADGHIRTDPVVKLFEKRRPCARVTGWDVDAIEAAVHRRTDCLKKIGCWPPE